MNLTTIVVLLLIKTWFVTYRANLETVLWNRMVEVVMLLSI